MEIFFTTFPYNVWLYPVGFMLSIWLPFLAGLVWPGTLEVGVDWWKGRFNPPVVNEEIAEKAIGRWADMARDDETLSDEEREQAIELSREVGQEVLATYLELIVNGRTTARSYLRPVEEVQPRAAIEVITDEPRQIADATLL